MKKGFSVFRLAGNTKVVIFTILTDCFAAAICKRLTYNNTYINNNNNT